MLASIEQAVIPPLLPEPPALAAFAAASVVLALVPGPGVLYIVARSLQHGRRAGFASVAGVALGNLGNAAAAALGLAALFAVSSTAFAVVKWAGALVLLWMGVRALRRPAAPAAGPVGPPVPPVPLRRVVRDGALVALLNPKTTLFFAAFLPQFLRADAAGSALQGVVLGALFVLIAAASDGLYVLAASGLRTRVQGLRGAVAAGRWLAAGTYFGLGLWAAFGGRSRH